ncbi:MAG: phosphoenolpyruvate hydrolase family protein [Alphaproteobacteria bacterium]|nr:phosphoenolpyruvate hydrolase family protein [Alphaproteobacteria bacterium]
MLQVLKDGSFLIGAAIGSGSTAMAAERGKADFLIALNAGRLRSMGVPSIACMLPIFDAAALTENFAKEEVLPQSRLPVLLGVNVWGGRLDLEQKALAVKQAGFAGAVNFPSCMHYPHTMQRILANAGRGIEQEVAQLKAIQDTGLTSMFYCATRMQARLAADVGLDMVCLNLGWNVGGAQGHRQRETIEEVAVAVVEIGRLIKRISPKTRFLLEGGPIETADDLRRLLRLAPIDGYVGGSTFERMPLEVSVADQVDRFRHAGQRRDILDNEAARLVSWARSFGFVGHAKAHLNFLARLKTLALTQGPVLLLAEAGLETLPSLKALGSHSGAAPSMVLIDLAGEDLPTRARSILFGSNESNVKRRPALEAGDGNLVVIFWPERLPAGTQRRLARAFRDGVFQISGSRRPIPMARRVVLISHATDLDAAGLDPSLISVLRGWSLRIPPVRERIDDLLLLLQHKSTERFGEAITREHFSADAIQLLTEHLWPGNETEIHTVLGQLLEFWEATSRGQRIRRADVLPLLSGPKPPPKIATEKDRIADALWRHGFNRGRTAQALGMSRKTLYNKIQKYGLVR